MLENVEILPFTLKIEGRSPDLEGRTPTYGKLSLEPFKRGYGMTLGNALRRVLLSSIPGAAITAVRIDGVLHEFSTIAGVREDVIEILMNLKHIPVRSKSKDVRVISVDSDNFPENFFKRAENPGVVTAGDLPEDSEVEFIDPSAKICTMEKDARLVMDLYIEQGTGYLSSERPRPSFLPVDSLLTDAIFSPVSRVNYNVEAARVKDQTDFERLTLEVWTNGVVAPDEAVKRAAQIIQVYFGHIVTELEQIGDGMRDASPDAQDGSDMKGPAGDEEFLARPVRDLELSIRSENCLLRGGIQTIGDLLQRSRDDLLKIRNLGKISLTEIEEKIRSAGLALRERKDRANRDRED